MSTKATITYGDDFHLYEDVFEPNAVYLELDDVDWLEVQSGDHTRVCIRFTLQKAVQLGLISEEYVHSREA